jgi:hypothetical protein
MLSTSWVTISCQSRSIHAQSRRRTDDCSVETYRTASPQSGGERAWPIWGIAMRCCIAMGLHRDGSKWDLEPKVNDERRCVEISRLAMVRRLTGKRSGPRSSRLVFWESHTADLLQSSCYSRPNTLSVGTYDTLFPIDADAVEAGIEVGFSTLKFRLATLVNGCVLECRSRGVRRELMLILLLGCRRQAPLEADADQSTDQLRCRHPPLAHHVRARYLARQTARGTNGRLSIQHSFDFEKNLPFHWRCRPAWEALISISGSPEEAVKTSPATDKHDLRLTTQRHVLALNIADAVLFLQRPYFTKALYEAPLNPCQSKYASSFLAVFERCLVRLCRCT